VEEAGAPRGGGRGSLWRKVLGTEEVGARRQEALEAHPPRGGRDPPLPGTAPPCNAMQCRLVIVTE
jgi:hypothetical protein